MHEAVVNLQTSMMLSGKRTTSMESTLGWVVHIYMSLRKAEVRRLATGLQTRDERALPRYEVALPRAFFVH